MTRPDAGTMAEIAEATGFSISTVSRALNRPELVAENTRKKVLKVADELSFHPNRAASGLRSGSHRCLALLVGDISQPWYSMIAKSVDTVCAEHSFALQLKSFGHDQAKALSYLARIPYEGVDGIIINTGDDLGSPEIRAQLARIAERGIHVVTIGQTIPGLDVPTILYDDYCGAEEATAHLVEDWGVPLVFLGAIRGSVPAENRWQGFSSVVRRHGQADGIRIVTDGYDYKAGYSAMSAHLRVGPWPKGVLASNDQLAVGAIRAITDLGGTVGTDIAVVGFGDLDFAPYLVPPLSSVSGSVQEIAGAATNRLISLVKGEAQGNAMPPITVPRKLVIRESSQPPPSAGTADWEKPGERHQREGANP
ncbi:LacI family DNA-binding transcriptional regulator [Saccharopolyspora spinosa]|uniref:LacI family DNA-binding transcriptional regulator n=1 Tax=Saccharopolyspora spinosa TaxID=60894 RepID=UPI000309993B|nr:LacI family DNA-binding transcriptional regulator [Saccharopolyspora spinosa]